MVDTKTPDDKKLSVPSKTLSLKPRVETGTVRQSFSHGRSKQVVVEKRGKRRIDGSPEPQAPTVVAKPAPAAPAPAPARPAPPRNSGSGVVLRTLTEDERSARASALADAKVREVEERRLAEEEARRRNSKEGIEQAEREAAEARRKAEEERHRQDEEAKRKAELEAKKRFGEAEAKAATVARAAVPVARAPGVAADITDEDEGPRQIRRGPGGIVRPATAPKTTAKPAPAKQRGRLTLVTALNADDVRERSIASFRRRTQRLKGHQSNEPKEKLVREVIIPEAINIQELANRMAERG